VKTITAYSICKEVTENCVAVNKEEVREAQKPQENIIRYLNE
jgi:hypothetical protein